jgi:hypothetical protein
MPTNKVTFSVRESPEGGYVAHAVGHPIFTQAQTMDELRLNVREAVRRHFGEGTELPAVHLEGVWPNGRPLGSAKSEFTVPDDFNDPLPKEIEDEFYK